MAFLSLRRSQHRVVFQFLNIFAGFFGALAAWSTFAQGQLQGQAATNPVAGAPEITASLEQAARTYITRSALEAPIRFLASDALGRLPLAGDPEFLGR